MRHGRTDTNQAELVAYARAFGASWLSMTSLGNGAPDGLLGLHGHTFLVELKTEKGSLTPDQQAFISTWRGSPVYLLRTIEDVERLLSSTLQNRRRATREQRKATAG